MRETGYPHGRPGYVIDHVIPLKRGGLDSAVEHAMADEGRRCGQGQMGVTDLLVILPIGAIALAGIKTSLVPAVPTHYMSLHGKQQRGCGAPVS